MSLSNGTADDNLDRVYCIVDSDAEGNVTTDDSVTNTERNEENQLQEMYNGEIDNTEIIFMASKPESETGEMNCVDAEHHSTNVLLDGDECANEMLDDISFSSKLEVGNSSNGHSFDFNLLPHVVLLKIISYLDIKERGHAACVSKKWYSACCDPRLWRKLDLNGRRLVTDSVLNRLSNLSSNITSLDISECMSCTEQGLQTALQNCRALHTLKTVRCPSMTDNCLSTVGQICVNLRVINLSMCPITDTGIEMLCQGCNAIEEMKLDQCRFVTSTSLVHIAHYCQNMQHLSVEHNTKINDDGVTELVFKCRKLKRLQVNSCGVSGQGVRSIATYSHNMTILDVRYCTTLNDDIVKEIVIGCPNLVILNLSLCFNVTDISAAHVVQHCTKLLSLYLVHCRITDEGMRILSVSGFGLERLDVSWCQDITDDGVKVLVEGCKTLKHLGLVRCDQVSNETITELSLGYPSIFLSTFMTEVNRMFKKAGLPEAIPPQAQ